jgi:hypothetical protein
VGRNWVKAGLVSITALTFIAGVWLTVNAGKREEPRVYSFCVDPSGGKEAMCKKIRSFRAPIGYFAHSAGYQQYDFLLINLLYPSMKPDPSSFADLLPFRTREVPPGEIPLHVTLRSLGRPFEEWRFDSLLELGWPGEIIPDRPVEMFGLRMRKESSIQDPLRKQQFIPANGEKTAVVECDLPWRGVGGSMFMDVSCRITSKLGNDFYIEYYIKRKDLPQWEVINYRTQQLIESFVAG